VRAAHSSSERSGTGCTARGGDDELARPGRFYQAGPALQMAPLRSCARAPADGGAADAAPQMAAPRRALQPVKADATAGPWLSFRLLAAAAAARAAAGLPPTRGDALMEMCAKDVDVAAARPGSADGALPPPPRAAFAGRDTNVPP
jgi:hypothetical protein